jgi:hypothetical protein
MNGPTKVGPYANNKSTVALQQSDVGAELARPDRALHLKRIRHLDEELTAGSLELMRV